MRRNRVRAVDSADRARAMTFRIAASILAIFAAGELIAPVATPAQGGPLTAAVPRPSIACSERRRLQLRRCDQPWRARVSTRHPLANSGIAARPL